MRVLVFLSMIVGVAMAGNVALPVPLVYSQTHLEPRKAFEYSSSVQTADYANYASVKSDNAGLATIATATAPLVPVVPTVQTLAVKTIAPVATVAVQPYTTSHVYTAPLFAARSTLFAPHVYTATSQQHQYIQPIATVLAKTAATIVEPAPIVETVVEHVALPAIVAQKSQYHSQDELGQAAYGHAEALQTHNAIQDAAGNKAGSYSYVAPDGRVLTTDYVADENGYRVATNALPVDVNHPAISRRRRSTLAVASVPLVKEATRIDIPGHSSTVRLDTHTANVLTAVPTVYASTYAVPAAHVAYAAPAAYPVAYTAPSAYPVAYTTLY